MSERAIFVHGKPGCGKSTCCSAMAGSPETSGGLEIHHFSVGTHFRGILSGEVDSVWADEVRGSAQAAREYHLPPSVLVHSVVEEYLRQHPVRGVILIDGYPKEPEQLPLIQQSVSSGLIELAGIIVIDVDDQEALDRQSKRNTSVSRHEPFDPTTARRRIDEFNNTTVPVIEALANQTPVLWVSGEVSPSELVVDFSAAVQSLVASRPDPPGVVVDDVRNSIQDRKK